MVLIQTRGFQNKFGCKRSLSDTQGGTRLRYSYIAIIWIEIKEIGFEHIGNSK